MEIIQLPTQYNKYLEPIKVELNFGIDAVYVSVICYDMILDSYDMGEYTTVELRFFDGQSNEENFKAICKELKNFMHGKRLNILLSDKLGKRYSKKALLYFLLQIRNQFGKEYLPKPLSYYMAD